MSEAALEERAQELAEVFSLIARTRMSDVPIVNPALSVAVIGQHELEEQLAYVLITPWFMNLIILPLNRATSFYPAAKLGESIPIPLPGGIFPCLIGEEAGLGRYLSCSFFSPMAEFSTQDQAVATAQAIAAEIFSPLAEEAPAEPLEEKIKPSRRQLLGLKVDQSQERLKP